ncbi:MAG: TetR family transcriptional regulator [Spirochaetales bacterium]|nr:TetR family transcriptional regulator [Spirochaetales bacterium]
MDKANQSEQTKNNILRAAQEEFILKGYDKARMEDIAAKAGVTKMMLYYYFNSKENMLQAISQNILKSAQDTLRSEFITKMDVKKLNPEQIKNKIKELITPNKEIITFIIKEFVKGSLDHTLTFTILKNFYDLLLETFEARGIRIKSREQYYIRMFFFQSVPLLMYSVFKDKFLDVFGYDEEMTDRVFFSKFGEVIFDTLTKPPVK